MLWETNAGRFGFCDVLDKTYPPTSAIRYIEGVRRGSNTQVCSTAVTVKIRCVNFSTCSSRKVQS